MMNPDLLTIFARFPRIGHVKTRLIPPLDPESATRVYEAFLIDILHRMIPSLRADIEYSVAGERDDHKAMSDFLRRNYRFGPDQKVITRPQGSGDLGVRLSASFRESFQQGRRRVVVLGADHPSVPVENIEEAFDRIDDVDVVIGPSDDGGFYALGMSSGVEGLLDNLPWSTSELYDAVMTRIRSLGLRYAELPGWYDIDRPADLMRLYREVEAGLELPATRDVFSHLGFGES
jgi:hypothetical protein